MNACLNNYKHQRVRDLAWSCFGPDLMSDFGKDDISACQLSLTTERKAWLQALDCDPAPLLAFLQRQRSPRLGVYFEVLWQFFIASDPSLELIVSNHPIHQQGRTLGEFDIIYRDNSTNKICHLELAIKFYLDSAPPQLPAQGQYKALSRWLGPNANDRLDKKIARLISHQIQLSEADESKAWLHSQGIEKIHKQIALKGQLFSPNNRPANTGTGLNVKHAHHQWLRVTELDTVFDQYRNWIVLQKPYWISPARVEETDEAFISVKQPNQQLAVLENYFSENVRPVLLCALEQDGQGVYREQARYFVTSESWPLI